MIREKNMSYTYKGVADCSGGCRSGNLLPRNAFCAAAKLYVLLYSKTINTRCPVLNRTISLFCQWANLCTICTTHLAQSIVLCVIRPDPKSKKSLFRSSLNIGSHHTFPTNSMQYCLFFCDTLYITYACN